MVRHRSGITLSEYLEALAARAAEVQGVPEPVVRYAVEATRRALGDAGFQSAARRRCAAYFWAVVRRRLVSVGGSSLASARFVLAAVVEDLSGSGRDAAEVWREIDHGWRDRVPAEVIEEFRLRLCA